MTGAALVTGGFGFLGRAVARELHRQGLRVHGIGRGHWPLHQARASGFDTWLDAGISLAALMSLEEPIDFVVHCAGGSSVGYSIQHPLDDFSKTVQGTAELLEWLRLKSPGSLLVYPSSAGVYGAKPDAPIRESDPLTPISPYGYHKKIVEDLLSAHSAAYGRRVAIIRFFSIYGPGLTKQLLWDAAMKLRAAGAGSAEFWGTGEETRDWIHSADAAGLIWAASRSQESFSILNGASGRRITVRETLEELRAALGCSATVRFNNQAREGDPRFYHADIARAGALGWRPAISLPDGIREYARWLGRQTGEP